MRGEDIADKLADVREQAMRRLNADLFFDGIGARPVKVPTRRERVTAYLQTLWRALKGEQPYDDY